MPRKRTSSELVSGLLAAGWYAATYSGTAPSGESTRRCSEGCGGGPALIAKATRTLESHGSRYQFLYGSCVRTSQCGVLRGRKTETIWRSTSTISSLAFIPSQMAMAVMRDSVPTGWLRTLAESPSLGAGMTCKQPVTLETSIWPPFVLQMQATCSLLPSSPDPGHESCEENWSRRWESGGFATVPLGLCHLLKPFEIPPGMSAGSVIRCGDRDS